MIRARYPKITIKHFDCSATQKKKKKKLCEGKHLVHSEERRGNNHKHPLPLFSALPITP